ncbi:hypothetical protein QAD02_021448 [Eretmocerus hayati]|uniref:Uncharacterized protein n=1 Tax=Eretmocerus hayati TaxID=131215 RepID=A0ACC2PQG4_9HYME|nr:hypothetical protein QAD02_021448 [Eretmocerus hayati]
MKAASTLPEFEHVTCFRRQVYVSPEDAEKLPSSIRIEFENTKYWIYLSSQKLKCFLCGEEGHAVKDCKSDENNTNNHDSTAANNANNSAVGLEAESKQNNDNIEEHDLREKSQQFDGARQSTSASNNTTMHQLSSNSHHTDQTSPNLVGELAPAEVFLHDKTKKNPLDFERTKSFLVETYGHKNPIEVDQKYCSDLDALVQNLSDLQSEIHDKKLIQRIEKLSNRLQGFDTVPSTTESSAAEEEY